MLQTSQPSLLRLSLKRHTEKAVRSTIHAQRIAEKLREALKGTEIEGHPPTSFLIIDNSYFSTTAGEGSLYDHYCKYKNIAGCIYTGKNVKAAHPEKDKDVYKQSRLRMVPFDHAFYHVKKDVDKRKFTRFLDIC